MKAKNLQKPPTMILPLEKGDHEVLNEVVREIFFHNIVIIKKTTLNGWFFLSFFSPNENFYLHSLTISSISAFIIKSNVFCFSI